MPAKPIRAIFMLKERRSSKLAAPIDRIDELMCALRAKPRKKTLARAAKAVSKHYAMEMIPEGSSVLEDPAPGLCVLHFELTIRKPGLDFQQACQRALAAMNLSPKGDRRAIELVYPACGTVSYSAMEELDLPDKLEWFRRRMGSILMATSCELDRLALIAHCSTELDESVFFKRQPSRL